jgi:hypothetical protein
VLCKSGKSVAFLSIFFSHRMPTKQDFTTYIY